MMTVNQWYARLANHHVRCRLFVSCTSLQLIVSHRHVCVIERAIEHVNTENNKNMSVVIVDIEIFVNVRRTKRRQTRQY
jgi:hypothetical protein